MICIPTRLAHKVPSSAITHGTTTPAGRQGRGKRRAVEDRSQADSGTLTLRSTAGFPDPVLFIPSIDGTVRDVKAKGASRAVPGTVSRALSRYTMHVLSAEGTALKTDACWAIAHGWSSVASPGGAPWRHARCIPRRLRPVTRFHPCHLGILTW